MINIIIGFCTVLLSMIYLINLYKRRKNNDLWEVSMKFKGLVGGIGFLVIGIILIIKGLS